MSDSYHRLQAWILSKKDPQTGKLRTDADGNVDLTSIELNNNAGTINRTWLAKHLEIYDRSAFKTVRCSQAIRTFETELGIAPTGKRLKRVTASQAQFERLTAEKEKLVAKLLQVSSDLKEAQKELKERNKLLAQYAEIRRVRIETGRNVPGLHVVAPARQEQK